MFLDVHLASGSGNAFAYLWEDEVGAGFDAPAWARHLGRRDRGLALDGLFLLARPEAGAPWRLEHWDADGSSSFCSNGSRAALAVPGAPQGEALTALSNGLPIALRRDAAGIGIRMPEGSGFGLEPQPLQLPWPFASGWIGNPQLVVEREDVEGLDLARFAPPLRHHPAFPSGANVNVLQVLGEGEARIRSWERGVEGETRCCGTGCALAGAWLAQRSGRRRWVFQVQGPDPVTVEVGAIEAGFWRELWLSGAVDYAGCLRVPRGAPGAP